jgi:hypothetical protein
MNKKIFLQSTIFLFGIIFSLKAQNLVPNPSFENYINCPSFMNQLTGNTGNWFSNPIFTPDYFNSCEPNSNLAGNIYPGVPHNLFGFQHPATGNGYAGFIAYVHNYPEQREFISTQLNSSLSIGTKYFVSFKVNMAWEASYNHNDACNNIGIRFSVDNLQSSWPFQLNIAQIYSANIINDTLGWTTISGSFIATDTSKYITIGNLFEDALTQVQDFNQMGVGTAYYYLDDVCVSSDSATCYSLSIGQIPNINFEKIQVYPNPTNELIVVELPFSMIKKGCNISVRNTVGEEVFKSTNLKQNLYIDTKNWGAKGLYFIDISDDKQNRISINKIIVQ